MKYEDFQKCHVHGLLYLHSCTACAKERFDKVREAEMKRNANVPPNWLPDWALDRWAESTFTEGLVQYIQGVTEGYMLLYAHVALQMFKVRESVEDSVRRVQGSNDLVEEGMGFVYARVLRLLQHHLAGPGEGVNLHDATMMIERVKDLDRRVENLKAHLAGHAYECSRPGDGDNKSYWAGAMMSTQYAVRMIDYFLLDKEEGTV